MNLAKESVRLRTTKGAIQNYRRVIETVEGQRCRRASANRILTILTAALNGAYRNEKIAADDAWRRARPFSKTDAPRHWYLDEDRPSTAQPSRTRSGKECPSPTVKGKRRCRMHGGTNPGTSKGSRNALKNGGYLTQAKAAVQYIKAIARLFATSDNARYCKMD